MKTLVISGLGVSKTIIATDNTLEFTPTKAGQYRMSCTMGMGNGLVIVEDEQGNVPDTPLPAASSSGGCGCGG
jgi:plastocyanin domain-containing protein